MESRAKNWPAGWRPPAPSAASRSCPTSCACRPKDVPQDAEKIAVAVDASSRDEFIGVLEARLPDLSATQAARVRRVIKQAP